MTKSLQIWCGLGVLLLGIAVRLPLLNQSLWYDEMTTLADYVIQPWSKVVAAGHGDYVPNNHVLHTILAKLVYQLFTGDEPLPPREAVLRLPALVCGLLVPFALAWPMRRDTPLAALAIALVAMLNPWLVDLSVEARGYTLLLLLGIIATNCLIARPVCYVVALSLAIYTVPLAVFLIPAHAVVIAALHRSMFRQWALTTGAALAIAVLLYLPMYRGLLAYYRNPYEPSADYRLFLDALPRYALAGIRWPTNPDPLMRMKDPPIAAVFWALPVILIAIGSALAWKQTAARRLVLTLGLATTLGVVFPLVLHNAGEVRFVTWILPWYCLCVVMMIFSISRNWGGVGKALAVAGFAALLSWQLKQDLTMPPNQQMREGMALADKVVPGDRYIMVLYLGARETVALYGSQAGHHDLLPAPDIHFMSEAEKLSLRNTGHLPWVVIAFEEIACGRDEVQLKPHPLWNRLRMNYHLAVPRLPGRLTPVAIYKPDAG